jgi:group I intron endonuclease
MEEIDQTGVYIITTPSVNDRLYIGSAAQSFRRRWATHKNEFKKQKHHCKDLQKIHNEHNFDVLVFKVVEVCLPDDCLQCEARHMESYPWDLLYNQNPVPGSLLGFKFSEEQKRKLSESLGGITDPVVLNVIATRYELGEKPAHLADEFGVDRKTIRNYLEKGGVDIRPLPSRDLKLAKQLEEDYGNGVALKQLAKEYEIDFDTVKRILEKNGVDLRDNSGRQKLRFEDQSELEKLSQSHGGKRYPFIHRDHGFHMVYPWQLRQLYADTANSAGSIAQLYLGQRDAYNGWEIADEDCCIKGLPHSWKMPTERVYPKGEDHHRYGKKQPEESIRRGVLKKRKLSNAQILEVLKMLEEGYAQAAIAEEYNIGQSVVSRINTRSRGYSSLP